MDINYMKSFMTIMECGNFQKAAESLEISRSEILKHISKIEEELGTPLFIQDAETLELTKSGELFRSASWRILNLWEQGYKALGDFYFQGKTQLAIGAISVMVPYRITDMIFEFQKEHPEINLHVFSENDQILKEKLKQRQIELAFLHGRASEDEALESLLYDQDSGCVLLWQQHPLANRAVVSIRDLANEQFLLLPEKTGIHQEFLRICKESGVSPKIAGVFRNSSSIFDLVSKKCGVGFLMRASAAAQLQDGVVLKRLAEKSVMNIYLSRYREVKMSEAARLFWTYIGLRVQGGKRPEP